MKWKINVRTEEQNIKEAPIKSNDNHCLQRNYGFLWRGRFVFEIRNFMMELWKKIRIKNTMAGKKFWIVFISNLRWSMQSMYLLSDILSIFQASLWYTGGYFIFIFQKYHNDQCFGKDGSYGRFESWMRNWKSSKFHCIFFYSDNKFLSYLILVTWILVWLWHGIETRHTYNNMFIQ